MRLACRMNRWRRGTLDQNGFASVDGIDPGIGKITFPELDKDAWEPV
jgi:hypothetical protein